MVNPATANMIIKNEGTIERCMITLNSNDNGYSRFYNGDEHEGNIISSSITLNGGSEFYNGCYDEGNINDSSIGNIISSRITLNGGSVFQNSVGSPINNCKITAIYGSVILNAGTIHNCTIIAIDASAIFNIIGTIDNCTFIFNNASVIFNCKFYSDCEILNSYIFLHDGAIFQNFYVDVDNHVVYYGIITDSYIFAFDGCKIQNNYDDESGTFDSTIIKFSDNCTIDSEIEKEKTIDMKNIVFMSTTEIKKLEDNNKNLSDTNTRLEAENEILNNQINELKTEIENTNGNTNYIKDNTLSKLLLLSYLTQKDNSSVL